MIVEIGPGSGIISTFLTRIVNESHPTATLAIDINMDACRITRDTYHQNKVVYGDTIRSNLLQCTLQRLQNKVDVLLFNPPYVPTSSEETFLPTIESAYAGGEKGREVIDVLLPNVQVQ
ncbi:uncharacterized protein [Blastocystis hominis]|uniref:Methyltransferase small domain-containing protein n=1 Tax=Blastocystis hominis TaxID=12968 RepID=D8M7Y0_BLAHO|nr:uncharacterized protein [Blastocystis hominis]CBK24169.2 unnamed protein product [Blastocystis hominis]|eukprot:XP_012898217.1 uncharacterized protein [Blastocystis hominis]